MAKAQKQPKKHALTPQMVAAKWKPGVCPNPGGRPKGSVSIVARLRKLLAEGLDGKDLVEALAKVGLSKALRGDHKFWQEIVNRIDGKVPDKVEGTIGGGLTINVKVPGEQEQ